jgi:crotonobetainyl-CoA:carnitine CoA-transferase CaiB-like acyl-CoA transferase
MAPFPLANLKVLDLGHYVAGPYTGKLFADLGADVIKVERPGAGDPARRIGPFAPQGGPDSSALFLHLNTSKRGVTLNLKSASGRSLFLRLAESADLVIENFRPGVMADFGLDYRTLAAVNPALSLLSISSFGQTGPYRDRKATELTMFAASGSMYSTGEPEREPLRYAGYQSQLHAGLVAASGALAAVYASRTSGRGQWIDISVMEAAAHIMEPWLMYPTFSGRNGLARRGPGSEFWPRSIFPCADGYVFVTLPDFKWPEITRMIGRPDLAENSDFATVSGRFAHLEEVELALVPWLITRTKEEIFREMQSRGMDWAALFDTAELLANEHYRERGFWHELEHPAVGKLTYPGPHYRFSETAWDLRRPAPMLGQHNAEVFSDLGVDAEGLDILCERGVI